MFVKTTYFLNGGHCGWWTVSDTSSDDTKARSSTV